MEGCKRILILSGILLFPLIVWLSFADSNNPRSFVPEAYGAEGTEDHSEGKEEEHQLTATDDHQEPGAEAQAHAGSILLPQKRTTLLSRAQLRGYAQYQFYCAACHGTRGNGDGTNAKNLSIPPRRHSNASYMANLSDAYLSRVIREGGISQGLSSLMPPWGGVLSDKEMLNLISFLRILPEDRMMASVEEYQKSAGMGDHHQGGAMAGDQHGAAGADDHHAGEADPHEAAGSDDDHAGEDDQHETAGADDHHADEADDHEEAGSDDDHADEADDHEEAGTDDDHAAEADEHEAAGTDDDHAAEADQHETAATDDHHMADEDDH